MKAIGYIRVSTQEQARSGISLADQEQRITEYCAFHHLDLIQIFKDPGVSAGKPLSDRPSGKLLLEALRDADAVVAIKLDRLFRDTIDCLQTVGEWDRDGKILHLLDFGGESLNTKSAMGKCFLTMAAAFGELEREMARERILAAHQHLRDSGSWKGGPLAFGYKYQGGEVVVDKPSADVVRGIYSLRIRGETIDKISGHVNKSPLAVRRILKNETYKGKYKTIPAII